MGLEIPPGRSALLAILLAATAAATHHPASVEGRVALLEARQMLDAQQIWSLRSELPADALKAIADVNLHVQHDQEQEDKVHELSLVVQLLQQRLSALELALQDKGAVENARIPVAPMQLQALEMPARNAARKSRKALAAAQKAGHKPKAMRARIAAAP